MKHGQRTLNPPDFQVRIELLASFTADPSQAILRNSLDFKRFDMRWPWSMKRLDLRTEFADVYAFVADRVRSFDPDTNDGPGDGGPVARIDLGFGLYESGWACLVFDTRPDAEPDGEWNEYIEETALERPRWAKACAAVEAGPLALILPDGNRRELPEGDASSLATALGDMLRDVLIKARVDGVFAILSRRTRCELGVEEQNGTYGWPGYEARGAENLA